jgi:hypothetical protein
MIAPLAAQIEQLHRIPCSVSGRRAVNCTAPQWQEQRRVVDSSVTSILLSPDSRQRAQSPVALAPVPQPREIFLRDARGGAVFSSHRHRLV